MIVEALRDVDLTPMTAESSAREGLLRVRLVFSSGSKYNIRSVVNKCLMTGYVQWDHHQFKNPNVFETVPCGTKTKRNKKNCIELISGMIFNRFPPAADKKSLFVIFNYLFLQ